MLTVLKIAKIAAISVFYRRGGLFFVHTGFFAHSCFYYAIRLGFLQEAFGCKLCCWHVSHGCIFGLALI